MSSLMLFALSLACLAPVANLKKPTKGDEPLPAVRSPGTMFSSTEDFIFAQLNLTKEQHAQLNANNLAAQQKYAEIRQQFKKDGDLWAKVRAYEATANWNKGETKRIMTGEQHALYLKLWHEAMAPYIANSQKIQGARALPAK